MTWNSTLTNSLARPGTLWRRLRTRRSINIQTSLNPTHANSYCWSALLRDDPVGCPVHAVAFNVLGRRPLKQVEMRVRWDICRRIRIPPQSSKRKTRMKFGLNQVLGTFITCVLAGNLQPLVHAAEADLILHHGKVAVVDERFSIHE